MNETFDPGFHFDKGSKIGQTRDSAVDALASLVFVRCQIPGLRLELFEPERNAPGCSIHLQNLDLKLLTHGQQILRMIHPAPRDISDVQQPIDSANIDEGAVAGKAA